MSHIFSISRRKLLLINILASSKRVDLVKGKVAVFLKLALTSKVRTEGHHVHLRFHRALLKVHLVQQRDQRKSNRIEEAHSRSKQPPRTQNRGSLRWCLWVLGVRKDLSQCQEAQFRRRHL